MDSIKKVHILLMLWRERYLTQ